MSQKPKSPETLIEFPCDFELKAMGDNDQEFIDLVFETVIKYVPDASRDNIRLQESKTGKYVSVKLKFYASCIEQIHGIYGELNPHPKVHMTL